MLKIKHIAIICCFSMSSLFAISITPAGVIDDMTNTQNKGNDLMQKQKIEFDKIVALMQKTSYMSNAYMVFLASQRNKLIHNDIKLEAWE